MSLYEGSKTNVRSEFYMSWCRSVLSPLLFAIVVNVVTENAREGLTKEVLYAHDLVLTSETMEGLKERFINAKVHWIPKD